LTTTTMDLRGVSASRADRKTPRPGTGPQVSLAMLSMAREDGVTAWGRPPPAYLERLVTRAMWALCGVAVAWVFGADLARWVWRMASASVGW
jgi:hypothetical protein